MASILWVAIKPNLHDPPQIYIRQYPQIYPTAMKLRKVTMASIRLHTMIHIPSSSLIATTINHNHPTASMIGAKPRIYTIKQPRGQWLRSAHQATLKPDSVRQVSIASHILQHKATYRQITQTISTSLMSGNIRSNLRNLRCHYRGHNLLKHQAEIKHQCTIAGKFQATFSRLLERPTPHSSTRLLCLIFHRRLSQRSHNQNCKDKCNIIQRITCHNGRKTRRIHKLTAHHPSTNKTMQQTEMVTLPVYKMNPLNSKPRSNSNSNICRSAHWTTHSRNRIPRSHFQPRRSTSPSQR